MANKKSNSTVRKGKKKAKEVEKSGWLPPIKVGGTSKSSQGVADQEPTEKDRERLAPGGADPFASKSGK